MNKNSLLNQRYICPIGADGVHPAVLQRMYASSYERLGDEPSCRHTVSSGKETLPLEVIAEGVETEQQLIDRTRLTRLPAEVLQVV